MPRHRANRLQSVSQDRTRDRSVCRHRGRHHRDTISRSVSRELFRNQEEEPVQAIKNLVTSQHEIILDLLSEHRAEVDEKIHLKARCFSSKQIEKQYHVNTEFREFRELTNKITIALAANEIARA